MEAAGLSDEQGRLAVGGTSIGTPPVPTEVELRDGWLAWRARSRANARSGTDVRDMLDTFIRIKSDEGVRRFAERFGVLLLCEEHGLPSGHVTQEPTPELLLGGCWPRLADDDQFRLEPLEGWHRLVAEARTMVSIGASLHRGTVPAPERWDILGELPWVGLWTGGSLASAKRRLSIYVNRWLEMAGAELAFLWSEGEPELELGGNTFQLLSLQLAQTLSRSTFSVCDGCHEPYQRRGRRAPRGRNNYCPDCRKTRAARVRKRASVERQR